MSLLEMLLLAACGIALGYLMVLRTGLRAVAGSRPAPDRGAPLPISVIIAAKNEEDALPILREALSRQSYPAFEVLLVDDGSEDATRERAIQWAVVDPRVRVLQNVHTPGKKGALLTGMAAARFPSLLLTDADAEPHPDWVAEMARYLALHPRTVVTGFPKAAPGAGGVARYELLQTQLLTSGSCGVGRPFMAYGISLGFSAEVFREAGGYVGLEHLPGGDDDLLLQRMARLPGVTGRCAVASEAQVTTRMPATLWAWIAQKRRHYADGRAYPRDILAHLALFHGTALFLWMGVFTGGWGLAALLVRLAALMWVMREAGKTFGERWLWVISPLLDFMLTLFLLAIAPISALFPPRKWAGRESVDPESIPQRLLSALFQKRRAG